MGEVIITSIQFLASLSSSSIISGLVLSIALKFYTSVTKGLKLKVRKLLGLIVMFIELTGE